MHDQKPLRICSGFMPWQKIPCQLYPLPLHEFVRPACQPSEAGEISLPGWFWVLGVYHRATIEMATIENYNGLPPGDVVMLWIWRAAKFNRRFGSHVRKQDDIAHHFRDQNRCHILAQTFMHAIAKMQIVRK